MQPKTLIVASTVAIALALGSPATHDSLLTLGQRSRVKCVMIAGRCLVRAPLGSHAK